MVSKVIAKRLDGAKEKLRKRKREALWTHWRARSVQWGGVRVERESEAKRDESR